MPAPLLGKRTVTFDTEIKWTPLAAVNSIPSYRRRDPVTPGPNPIVFASRSASKAEVR